LLAAAIGLAHHSTAPFDMTKDVRISGTVVEFAWMNPHSYIVMDVKGTRWKMEAEALNLLRRNGWTKDTLKAGDEITCIGARAKDPEVHAMKCFTVEFKDGRAPLVATPVGVSGKQPTDLR
jgi:hypothetical protein